MAAYVALLRAVNVGGTGKLPMAELKEIGEAAGFHKVRTYIASGNLIFESGASADRVREALEEGLRGYAGAPVGVLVRTAAEMAEVVARNPFADAPGSRVAALFLAEAMPGDPLDGIGGLKNEQIASGKRELFIHYPDGMGRTRLRIPTEKHGTARNMNTVAKLAEMSRALR